MSHGFELEGQAVVEVSVPAILAPLHRMINAANRVVMGISMVALLAASSVLTLSVVLRYFLKVPTDWQDETAVFLLVGITFLCGAFVQSQRGHVGIEAVAAILPPGLNRLRQLLCDAASCGFCSFFAWKSWSLFHEAWAEGQTTESAWAPPLALPYSLMAAGMTLLALQIALQVLSACLSKDHQP